MDCPVCKYPNAQGATHCGMCYEVFNRSAAQAYMHAVKKERRQTEGIPEESTPTTTPSEPIAEKAKAVVANIDWNGLRSSALDAVKRFKKVLAAGAGVILLWILAGVLLNPSLWYHLFGKKLTYAFPGEAPASYLVGMKLTVKSWSERQGRLDTPMEEFHSDEIGNLLVEKKTSTDKNRRVVSVAAKEWIQILNDATGSTSHTIPLAHPSLASARLVFDAKGALLERRYTLSPRLAKSLPFLVPRFPKNSLRHGQTWSEPVEWLDLYNNWVVRWSGTLHWTIGELEPCGDNNCVTLTYTAEIHPQLRAGPEWARGARLRVDAPASTEGAALFDIAHQRLVSNTFSYDGLLYVPISDLGRIPWELRIGRRVKGQPGSIAIRFENKIDIRKN